MAVNVKNVLKYVVTFLAGGVLGSMATGAAIKQRLRDIQSNLAGLQQPGMSQNPGSPGSIPAGFMPMMPPEEAMKQLMENPEMVKQILSDPTVPQEAKALLKEFQNNPKLMDEMMNNLKAMNPSGTPYNAAQISPLPNIQPLAAKPSQHNVLTPQPVYKNTPVAPISATTLKV